MLNLGVRAHDLGRWPLEESARRLGDTGLSCLHLALHKALVGFEPVPGALTAAVARKVAAAYRARGLSIAVLGCYINPVHPEPQSLETGLLRFEELLRRARAFGCPVVATETGSLNPDSSYHPGTAAPAVFDRLVASFRRLAATAEAEGVTIGVEGVFRSHTVSTHDDLERLLAAVGSPALGVLYDPANFLGTPDEGRVEAAVDDALDRFGGRLVALHAKDCRLEGGVKTGDLPAGTGHVPYGPLLARWQREHPGLPVLLEDVSPELWRPARDFLLAALGH